MGNNTSKRRTQHQTSIKPQPSIDTMNGSVPDDILPYGRMPGFSFTYNRCCSFITDTECCICYLDYYDGMIMHMLPCDHVFHIPCLCEWYSKNPSCPMCRATLE